MKPIALQLYSVRQEAQADFEETLRTVASYGYDGVEFAGLFGHAPEKVRDLCKKYNLTPISAHVPLDDMTADPEALFYWKSEASSGYGALDDFGVHPLSLMQTLFGGVEAVMAPAIWRQPCTAAVAALYPSWRRR